MNLNKIIIVGIVGKDPELKAMPNGKEIASFSLATSKKWTANGEEKELTEWHNVVFFGKSAELIGKYVRKGILLLVEGSVQTRTWEKDGVKHYRTNVMGDTFQLPPRSVSGSEERFEKPDTRELPAEETGSSKTEVAYPEETIRPEDIPF